MPQLDNLDVELSARNNLAVFARLYRVPQAERSAAIDRALVTATSSTAPRCPSTSSRAACGGAAHRPGLVHRPRLLLLDEPTVGLDPQVRQELWALIDQLRSEGTTILMTTHYIEEAERLADTVAIMAEGQVVASAAPGRSSRSTRAEVVEVYGLPDRLTKVQAEAEAGGFRTRRTGTSVAILGAETANGTLPEGVRRAANLEDVFVLLTGEEVE